MTLLTDVIHCGDVLTIPKTLPDECVNCVVTSPPYWGLRDYKVAGQFGIEKTISEYVGCLVDVFREVRRVLKRDGTLWLNLGDTYHTGDGYKKSPNGSRHRGHLQATNLSSDFSAPSNRQKQLGLKPKDLSGIPWRVAFALQADGWYLRQDIIWQKPNPMPESVRDRCTKAHEYIFLLSKSERYFFDNEAIKEPAISGDPRKPYAPGQVDKRGNGHDRGGGKVRKTVNQAAWRNKRSVWRIAPQPCKGAHFATFPEALVEPCIKAGCPAGGVVLDPFMGSGTVAVVASRLGRHYIGIELNHTYCDMARQRIAAAQA